MNLIFIGMQASGKGTQAKIISEKLGLVHISTGDLLRGAEGELKQEVDKYVQNGLLVPDELMLRILKERLSQEDAKKGFILDGFPRNISQARELKKLVNIDKVIEIAISNEEEIERLLGRVNCPKCGALYNVITAPKPMKEGICDKCGSELYKRQDDNEESIRKRLEIYHNETEPILNEYPFIKVDGSKSIEEVSEGILEELEKN